LTRAEVEEVILNGFFPEIDPRDLPKKSGRAALQEMGLPFASEPAITKHLAAFLKKHSRSGYEALGMEGEEGVPRPDAILLNGGVFNSERIASRLVEVVSSWWPERTEIPLLKHRSLDLAVARGAAAYGLVRHGFGRKISGGSAHAFYLGIAGSKQNEGTEKQLAVCLIPRGFEEGEKGAGGDRIETGRSGGSFDLGRGQHGQRPGASGGTEFGGEENQRGSVDSIGAGGARSEGKIAGDGRAGGTAGINSVGGEPVIGGDGFGEVDASGSRGSDSERIFSGD
jgi:hypothetical protein